jgi:hypothetical protein
MYKYVIGRSFKYLNHSNTEVNVRITSFKLIRNVPILGSVSTLYNACVSKDSFPSLSTCVCGGPSDFATRFSCSNSVLLRQINFCLQTVPARRTKGRRLETLKKSIHFGNQGAYEKKVLRFSKGQVVLSITTVFQRVSYVFVGSGGYEFHC